MLENNTLINVTNRSYGSVGYEIQDLGIKRRYESNETKEITYEELKKLSYSIGGKRLIEKYLVIDNADAVAAILGEVEPEYFYTVEDVKALLLNGSLAQLEDCLDFADTGVIDLVKKMAVELEINDVSKRKAIFNKTGFNIDNAIDIKNSADEEDGDEAPTARRAAPISKTETKPVRQAEVPSKYKVIK